MSTMVHSRKSFSTHSAGRRVSRSGSSAVFKIWSESEVDGTFGSGTKATARIATFKQSSSSLVLEADRSHFYKNRKSKRGTATRASPSVGSGCGATTLRFHPDTTQKCTARHLLDHLRCPYRILIPVMSKEGFRCSSALTRAS